MTKSKPVSRIGLIGLIGAVMGGCAPTIHVMVDPITINAKLDADVRIRLDKEVQSTIAANPDIF